MSEITDGTTKFVITQSLGVLPGTVTAFSGTFKDGYPIDKNTGLVNREWHLCDGTNGTPDLRNRFIYGGNGTNSGATGGEASHKLTVEELPKITPSFDGGGTALVVNNTKHTDTTNGLESGVLWGDMPKTVEAPFNTIGGNQPHNNMPPYFVLAFIVKL